jgi:predicted RNA binding protein YcfA (HicA-like mRNA interferase family)
MPNKVRNWQYENVAFFLECHKFTLVKREGGSHEFWLDETKKYLVNVHRPHNSKGGYPPKTLQSMIEQSGLERAHWLKWVSLKKGVQKKCACCPEN